ncbi:LisH domain-containing protein [Schistosoma japonicum]|uniref:LisH domain-containing protein n=1 Tax=Schistosoma japonicum TaxID=6182 RepID=A0A4Z2CYB9_SCHJA|nr:LisH domain-containing protein [Schistosoma japonicum]
MVSSDNLKQYLRTTLNDDGFLNEIKIDVLKKMFDKIQNQSPKVKTSSTSEIHSNIKLLIDELIIEYLNFENLSFTESIFRHESGHGNLHNLPRQFLCQTLRIKPTVNIKSLIIKSDNNHNYSNNELCNHKSPTELINQPIPLLYYIVHYLMMNGLDRICSHDVCNNNGNRSTEEPKSTTTVNNNNNEDHFNVNRRQMNASEHVFIHEPIYDVNHCTHCESNLC